MSEQPEAIRLAAVCDIGHPLEDDVVLIGQELRRLHAVESGAKVELMRRDNLIDSLNGLCESYRTQVESLQSALDANTAAFDLERAERIKAQAEAKALAEVVERMQEAQEQVVAWYEYSRDVDAWFLAYGKNPNPNAKTRPLVFGDLATPQPEPAWSPAYTRGPARQSAPVAAVPAMVPLHSDAIGELAEKYAYRDFTNDYPQTIDDLVRDVEAHHGIGLTVGDGAHSGALHCKKTWWRWVGTPQHEHGRATYYCNTVNEITVSLPNFEQAHMLAMAIEAQAQETRQDARAGLLSAISRIEP